MKILHIADLHIGKTVSDFSMIQDQEYILGQILEIIEQRKIDILLIAGDIYDKPVPSEEAVRVLDSFLCRLSEKNVETFLISGNHDSDERLHFGSSLFEKNNIHIAAKYDGNLYKKECQDEFGKVNFYLLPFVKASQVKHFYPEDEIESYEDAVRAVLSHARINPAERNILAAHQFVVGGGSEPVLGGSEGAAVLHVGTIEKIGADCFQDFDYVALGHIHAPQQVGRETVRYAGSPLKYSLSEVNHSKSVPVVTLGRKQEVSVELAELKPLRDMRHLKGTMNKLLDSEHISAPDDYIYVTLTDEEPVNDAMSVFQQYYPNTMRIMYDNMHTKEVEQADFMKVARERSYTELISDFYRMMYGCDMSREELRLMQEAAKEAGIIDETEETDN